MQWCNSSTMIKHRSFQCWGVGQHVRLSDVYQQRGNMVSFWSFNDRAEASKVKRCDFWALPVLTIHISLNGYSKIQYLLASIDALMLVITHGSCCCCCLVTKSYPTLWPHGLWPARLLCPWDFPGKNATVGCHFLLQGIFLDQGLVHVSCIGRQILYH